MAPSRGPLSGPVACPCREARSRRSVPRMDTCDVAIAGAGPAGLVSGLILARAGLRVTVIGKHTDFLRDFRGDTVHP